MPATTETVPGVEPRGFHLPACFDIHDPLTLVSHRCEIRVVECAPSWPKHAPRAIKRKLITRISTLAYAALFGCDAEQMQRLTSGNHSADRSLWRALRVGVRFEDGCEWDLLDCAVHGQRADLISHWLPDPLSRDEDARLVRRLDESLLAAVDVYSQGNDHERCIPVDESDATCPAISKAMTVIRLVQGGAKGYPGFWAEQVVARTPGPGILESRLPVVRREHLFRVAGVGRHGPVDGRLGLIDVAAWLLRDDHSRPDVLRSLVEQGLTFDHRRLLRASAQRCDDRLYLLLRDLGVSQNDFEEGGADFLSIVSSVAGALQPGSLRRSDLEAFLAAVQSCSVRDQIAAIRAAAAGLRQLPEEHASAA